MEWYLPITILPGIGFFILSTSNLLISLNDEIRSLNDNKNKYDFIIKAKIIQLKKLNYALIIQYLSALLFLIGGVIGALYKKDTLTSYLVLSGVILLTISIILLITYSVISLKIREKHLNI